LKRAEPKGGEMKPETRFFKNLTEEEYDFLLNKAHDRMLSNEDKDRQFLCQEEQHFEFHCGGNSHGHNMQEWRRELDKEEHTLDRHWARYKPERYLKEHLDVILESVGYDAEHGNEIARAIVEKGKMFMD
jgi:hypothetical protein